MATFTAQPGDLAQINQLRRCIQGEIPPWIHQVSAYGADPVALTADYSEATAEDGEPAWYFLCVPRKKEGSASRISRTAGAGTWKGERTFPLYAYKDGIRLQVGWKGTFSYMLKKSKNSTIESDLRLGWIMYSFKLMDGEDAQERCLCKVFRSPRKLPALAPMPPAIAPAAAAASSVAPLTTPAAATAASSANAASSAPTAASASSSAPVAASSDSFSAPVPASSSAPTTASASSLAPVSASSSAPVPASSSAPVAASAFASTTATPSAALGTTPALEALPRPPAAVIGDSSSSSAAAAAAATAPASPPKKWVQVQISNSPTKSVDKSSAKRVYQMMELLDQAEVPPPPSSKKMRRIPCKGWLTLEPPCSSNKQIA